MNMVGNMSEGGRQIKQIKAILSGWGRVGGLGGIPRRKQAGGTVWSLDTGCPRDCP